MILCLHRKGVTPIDFDVTPYFCFIFIFFLGWELADLATPLPK